MWARLHRFSSLPRPAKLLFLRAAMMLPLLILSLRLRGFRATQKSLKKSLSSAKDTSQNPDTESRVTLTARMVLAAARCSLISSTCLERSLCLWWLLARQGITAQFRIGVRKDNEQFAAHAWVERDGVVVGESQTLHLHYAAFVEEISGDLT